MYALPLPALQQSFAAALPAAESDDAELVARLQAGSEAAFRTLVEQYQDRIYRTVLALVR